jgi:hypothetical protein
MHRSRFLVLAGALLLLVGSRLPWMSSPVLFGVDTPVSRALEIGWEDNGLITGGIGFLLLLPVFFMKGKVGKSYTLPGALLAGLAVLVVAGCFKRVVDLRPAAGFFAGTGLGIYVTLLGALLALLGTLWPVPHSRQERQGTVVLPGLYS